MSLFLWIINANQLFAAAMGTPKHHDYQLFVHCVNRPYRKLQDVSINHANSASKKTNNTNRGFRRATQLSAVIAFEHASVNKIDRLSL